MRASSSAAPRETATAISEWEADVEDGRKDTRGIVIFLTVLIAMFALDVVLVAMMTVAVASMEDISLGESLVWVVVQTMPRPLLY